MRVFKIILLTGVCAMFSGCSGTSVQYYEEQDPTMNLREFFDGKIQGWGVVQDRKGRVIKRFDVDMLGRWEGGKGVLDEVFRYYDGTEQIRSWRLEELGNGLYAGEADDIVGTASGEEAGSALNLKYELIVPVGDGSYRFKFDDWMWRMNDNLIINRATMRKFGVRVAELTVVMKKL